ncbi:MAG: ribosome hibernation-promoting factor, HPF/YfiA family [Nitrospinota bacterium]
MQVSITARHTQLTGAMKGRVEERVQKLERLMDPPLSASVVLSVEKYRHSAELTLQANGLTFHGADVTNDLYTAIDGAVDKVRRQIEKHKNRSMSARVRERKRLADAEASPTDEDEPPGLARLGEAPPVVKTSRVPIKPMTVEEATLQLIAQGFRFFVFRNAVTEEVNVVYRLEDGQIGLVAPARD